MERWRDIETRQRVRQRDNDCNRGRETEKWRQRQILRATNVERCIVRKINRNRERDEMSQRQRPLIQKYSTHKESEGSGTTCI